MTRNLQEAEESEEEGSSEEEGQNLAEGAMMARLRWLAIGTVQKGYAHFRVYLVTLAYYAPTHFHVLFTTSTPTTPRL